MKLAAKLARKVKGFFGANEQESLLDRIVTKIATEMKSKSRRGKQGAYVPDYYQIYLRPSELELVDQQLKKEIKLLIEERIIDHQFDLRNELQLKFEVTTEISTPYITSDFRLELGTENRVITQETKMFQGVKDRRDSDQEINSTIQVTPVSKNQAYLKLLGTDKIEASFQLKSIETNIGRQSSNEIVISDPSVSRVHAQIINKKYYYLIRDLNSTNGVVVNGKFVTEKQLANQDQIRLGEAVLKFCYKE
ncbi:FHA domain-containing protein [Halanaerobaculum tunisiense]